MKSHLLLWVAIALFIAPPAGGDDLLHSVPPGGTAPAPPLQIKLFGATRVQDCANQLAALQEELKTLSYPAGWTLAITCTPSYWTNAVRSFRNVRSDTAFTHLPARLTVLNGAIFQQLRPAYRYVIAHELGHIRCDCDDEERANAIAWKLVATKPATPAHSGSTSE